MKEILDLKRYPIDQPGTEDYAQLLAWAKAELAATGMFSLEEFMHPSAAQQVVAETAEDMAMRSFHHAREHNIYFEPKIKDLAANHPALHQFRTSNHTLCGDQVAGTAITKTYEYAPLRRFLAEAMDKPELYLMEDALARLNVMSYGPADGLNWHFDRSEFTVTLLLQEPKAGGVFEYRTGLRSQRDQNYDGVAKLVQGQDPKVKSMSQSAGTLNVFKGINTAHRVTPVKGNRRRVIAVLCYYENPGIRFSPEEQLGFYGRTG
jgi:hypothetical protein